MLLRSLANASGFLVLLTVGSVCAVGCGDDTQSGGGGAGGEASGGNGGGDTGGVGTSGPINAPVDTWTWVPFAGTQCMDGSETGLAINISAASKDVLFFLDGGNACFNAASCASTFNLNGYDADTFAEQGADDIGQYPYLDRANADNPFKDYSFVYVPYCSGDLFFGDRADVTVAGKVRQFHGFKNITAFLDRVVPTFPEASSVILAGISAGGFGAALNYDHVAQAFGSDIKTTLIDDSGPPMAEAYIPQCLQEHFVETWGFDQTLPSDCTGCTGAFVEPFVKFLVGKYPDRNMALSSTENDEHIRQLLGFGENDCVNLMGAPLPYDAAKYKAGLEDLRDRVAAEGKLRMFLIPGDEHVVFDNPIGSVTSDGVSLADWYADAVAESGTWANVPAPQ